MGGYGISLEASKDLAEMKSDTAIHMDGGQYYSILQTIQAADGGFESKILTPREGWKHTHLFGGIGAFPYWRSIKPVPPNKPQVFFVNGTRNRNADPVDVKINTHQGVMKIQFEGFAHSIRIPY